MATRSERLNRLVIQSPCTASWETMEGEGAQRFCAECQREVYDFAQMTAASIHAELHARRGRMCARMTRQGGRLVTAPAFEPPPAATLLPRRRPSAVAATLMTAWLAATSAPAQRGPSPAAAIETSTDEGDRERDGRPARPAYDGTPGGLLGRVAGEDGSPVVGVEVVAINVFDGSMHTAVTGSDGVFRFAALAAGIYDLGGVAEDLEISRREGVAVQPGEQQRADLTASPPVVVAGGIPGGVGQAPLRQLFAQSDVVVSAVAGPSTVVERNDERVTVITELRVETVFKGTFPDRPLAYRHWEYDWDGTGWKAESEPGTRLLAFLDRSEDDSADGAGPLYEGADYGIGIKQLSDAERAAYETRLAALARIERRAERRGEKDVDEIVEWLVGTAEEPSVHGEAIYELVSAVEALNERAAEAHVSADVAATDLLLLVDRFRGSGGMLRAEPRPALVGAALTVDHRQRLIAALLATEGLSNESFTFYKLVAGWNAAAAREWLVRALGTPESSWDENDNAMWWLGDLADELGEEALQAQVSDATDRTEEIDELWADDDSEAARQQREERKVTVRRELRHRFAERLAGSS